jgi:hypothetical protein
MQLHFVNAQVVQEIKVLRSSVTAHEREVAERATLVTQERLIKAKVCLQACLCYGPRSTHSAWASAVLLG